METYLKRVRQIEQTRNEWHNEKWVVKLKKLILYYTYPKASDPLFHSQKIVGSFTFQTSTKIYTLEDFLRHVFNLQECISIRTTTALRRRWLYVLHLFSFNMSTVWVKNGASFSLCALWVRKCLILLSATFIYTIEDFKSLPNVKICILYWLYKFEM